MSAFDVTLDDLRFVTSADAGTPDCICSRCLKCITDDDVPIRMWPESIVDFSDDDDVAIATSFEYRFHPSCLGLSQ